MSFRQIPDDICFTASKRRRTAGVGSAPTFRRRLYAMQKEGSFTDVEIIVTTDNDKIKRMPAHKNVLAAMSSVIAAKLTSRWEEGGHGKDVIEIPLDVSMKAVEIFLEFLYTEELEQDLSVELYLDLIFLADHYEVEKLMDVCDWSLIRKIDVENCIKIYEKSALFQRPNCGRDSFNFLKKNLRRIFLSNSKVFLQMNASTWKTILELNYLPSVDEIELFKGLKRWKDENVEERNSDFHKLIKLIRFPLVGVKNFKEFVVPSEELDEKLIQQMLEYFAEEGPAPEPYKNSRPRNINEPKDPQGLQKLIYDSQSGDIIELDGSYSSFIIPENKSNLIIRAKEGKEAIIKANLIGIKIKAQLCKIEGLTIILNPIQSCEKDSIGVVIDEEGSWNVLKNITITGGSVGMHIFGNENSISKITINDPTRTGFRLGNVSSNNKILNSIIQISDKKIEADGFYLGGKGGNKLSSLVCKNVIGNQIQSSRNVINGLEISGKFLYSGLHIYSGSNHVENVNICGENASFHVNYNSERSTIINCLTEKMIIKGEAHKVENSKAKEIFVEGNRHKFNNCEADLLRLGDGTEIESNGCVFKVTVHFNSWDTV